MQKRAENKQTTKKKIVFPPRPRLSFTCYKLSGINTCSVGKRCPVLPDNEISALCVQLAGSGEAVERGDYRGQSVVKTQMRCGQQMSGHDTKTPAPPVKARQVPARAGLGDTFHKPTCLLKIPEQTHTLPKQIIFPRCTQCSVFSALRIVSTRTVCIDQSVRAESTSVFRLMPTKCCEMRWSILVVTTALPL